MASRRWICKAILQSRINPVLVGFVILSASLSCAVGAQLPQIVSQEGVLLYKGGTVEYKAVGRDWIAVTQRQRVRFNDQIRTRAASRAALRLADLTDLQIGENSLVEILPPPPQARASFSLIAGLARLFTRSRTGEVQFKTPVIAGGNRGTEVNIEVAPMTGRTVLTVDEGEVEVSTLGTNLTIYSGQQGIFETNREPLVVEGTDVVQWWLFYPAVLDPDELNLSPAEKADLAESLDAYHKGNLLHALEAYPENRDPQSEMERIYHASVLLAVGKVAQVEARLREVSAENPHVRALRRMIAAVNLRILDDPATPVLASEWLAQSYYEQSLSLSRDALSRALAAAEQAVSKSPGFGFALERLAELEFSHGRTAKALAYLEKSLSVSPENPQANALKGFLLLAQNRFAAALDSFEQALRLDGALGNAWLGRGLCRIRQGHTQEGRADLQTAAALEPNRSLLRSYLGKAFSHAKDDERARRELELATKLDRYDPTPWLYLALIDGQDNRINPAVQKLEKSLELNNNRRIYRSQLLLDQDRAVRSSSLATLYQDAGMAEVSVREAARAVSYDYANYSAHLFLAESFNVLRDPTRFNLRYETPWFNELLLANLLSPVGGTPLSQNISQQEYSRLFEQDRIGLSSSTEYRSDGQIRELASQFGNIGNTGWALDLDYQHNDGIRPNNDLDRIEWYSTIKQQITPQDSVLLLTKYQNYHSGDNFQRYDQSRIKADFTDHDGVSTNFSFDEYQKPLLVAGYHREWSPGIHTLVLGSRLESDLRFADRDVGLAVVTPDPNGVIGPGAVGEVPFDIGYRSELEIYTIELNQIVERERNTFVFGGYFKSGDFSTTDKISLGSGAQGFQGFTNLPSNDQVQVDFDRASGYGYYTSEAAPGLWLTAGVSYDWINYPANHRSPPVASGQSRRERLNPKAALIWSPLPEVTVRGLYAHSLGGVTFDESFRLEPAQLAGFSQSFRSVISESVVGSVSAPTYETAGAALDLKFKTRTYLGLEGGLLRSKVERDIGVFEELGFTGPPTVKVPSSLGQDLDYEEWSVALAANQLIGDNFSLGARHKFTQSSLDTTYPRVPFLDHGERATLHQTTAFVGFNHRNGFFCRAETQWYRQSNSGYSPALRHENFFQHSLFVGWRLKRQRGELSLGVLNLGGDDYRLNPLNPYSELPRERVFVARLKLNF